MNIKNLKIRLFGIVKNFRDYELTADPFFRYITLNKTDNINKYFCTFAAGFGEKLNILERMAHDTHWFDDLICFNADERNLSEIGLDEKSKEFIFSNKRGFGYWLWKPYFVKFCLSQVPENSIICYADAGMEMSKNGTVIFEQLIQMAYDHDGLFFDMPFIEKNWTKKSVLDQFPQVDRNSRQIQANFFILKKNERTIALLDDWIKYASADEFNNIDDRVGTEALTFIEHRHDQSLLSCLVKNYGMKTIPQVDSFDRRLYKENVDWINRYPFHSLRSKSSITYFK